MTQKRLAVSRSRRMINVVFHTGLALRFSTSKNRVAAIDYHRVSGVETGSVRSEIHGNTAEIFRLAPTPHWNSANRLGIERLPCL